MIILPEAEADIARAKAWYEDQQPGLGETFLGAVEDALARVSRMPEAPAVIFRDFRHVPTRHFPYAVYYRIEGGEILILAVVHRSRHPRSWQSRG